MLDNDAPGRGKFGPQGHGWQGKNRKKKAKVNLSTLVLFTVIHLVVLIVYTKFEDSSTHRC